MIFTNTNIEIRLTSTDSLTGATSANILYQKPNGQLGSWPASIQSNDIVYDTAFNDLDMDGSWNIQGEVFKSGARLLTSTIQLTVSKSL